MKNNFSVFTILLSLSLIPIVRKESTGYDRRIFENLWKPREPYAKRRYEGQPSIKNVVLDDDTRPREIPTLRRPLILTVFYDISSLPLKLRLLSIRNFCEEYSYANRIDKSERILDNEQTIDLYVERALRRSVERWFDDFSDNITYHFARRCDVNDTFVRHCDEDSGTRTDTYKKLKNFTKNSEIRKPRADAKVLDSSVAFRINLFVDLSFGNGYGSNDLEGIRRTVRWSSASDEFGFDVLVPIIFPQTFSPDNIWNFIDATDERCEVDRETRLFILRDAFPVGVPRSIGRFITRSVGLAFGISLIFDYDPLRSIEPSEEDVLNMYRFIHRSYRYIAADNFVSRKSSSTTGKIPRWLKFRFVYYDK